MNLRKLLIFLTAELILGVFLLTTVSVFPDYFSSVFSFPFEQIGTGLRWLSLTGRIGNTAAFVLWTLISILPLYSLFRHLWDKSRLAEHLMRILLSVMLFFTLYCMINPGMFSHFSPIPTGEMLTAMKAVFGCTVWSLVVCVLVLRLLGMFRSGQKEILLVYLKRILYVLCALFTAAIAVSISDMLSSMDSLQTVGEGINIVLRCVAAVLPYIMDIAVTIAAADLLDAMLDGEKADTVVPCARKVSVFCCHALAFVTISGSLYNIVQLLLSRWITEVKVHADIPLTSLAFLLLVLLLARLIIENKKLSDDNDLFI